MAKVKPTRREAPPQDHCDEPPPFTVEGRVAVGVAGLSGLCLSLCPTKSIPSIKSIPSTRPTRSRSALRVAAALTCLAVAFFARAEEPAASPEPEIAPSFTLPDAFDGLVRVKWPREKPVFLTFGEQASQTDTQAWSKRLKDEYTGRMEFIGVAWLEVVPKELHPVAQTVIKTSHPDVLIDKSGSCAARYQCKAGKVNAFVIAPDGVILMRVHEAITDERFREVQQLLEPFVKQAGEQESDGEDKQP
jgi:hypothetical protein